MMDCDLLGHAYSSAQCSWYKNCLWLTFFREIFERAALCEGNEFKCWNVIIHSFDTKSQSGDYINCSVLWLWNLLIVPDFSSLTAIKSAQIKPNAFPAEQLAHKIYKYVRLIGNLFNDLAYLFQSLIDLTLWSFLKVVFDILVEDNGFQLLFYESDFTSGLNNLVSCE